MATTGFIALPVSDLERARQFYTRLGWSLHPSYQDAGPGVVLVRDAEQVMVLSEDRHRQPVTPPGPPQPDDTHVVNALSVDAPEDVDAIVDQAVRAGAVEGDAQDFGFLHSRSFRDPDGNLWEVLWVDPESEHEDHPQERTGRS
ncbi:VOC family protein [Kocuria sp. M1R5S2]|uniref:VOC family protein n=1 Tax=Kocuria rhizosphaerae TaxID=3376285 RepID=UPI0037BDC7B8